MSSQLKIDTLGTLMGTIVRPNILFFGVPDFLFYQCQKELARCPFDLTNVKDPKKVYEYLSNPRAMVGVVFDKVVSNPLALVELAQKIGPTKWIVVSQDTSIPFRAKAFSALKVEALFDYPIVSSQLIAKIQYVAELAYLQLNEERSNDGEILHVPSLDERDGFSRLNLPQVEVRPRPVQSPVSFFKQEEIASSPGINTLQAEREFGFRSRWTPANSDSFRRLCVNSHELKTFLNSALQSALQDFGDTGRLSLVSFGVHSPLIDDNPKKFVVLTTSSSEDASVVGKTFDCRNYPEVLEAFRLKRPVFTRNIHETPAFDDVASKIEQTGARALAAIPLFRGPHLFGVLKARFPEVRDSRTMYALSDLSLYSKDLAPYVSHYDFFQRIYRRMETV